MLSLFHFLVRLGHLVTAVHQKDLLTYFVISKRFATDTSPSFFLFIFIFCVYIAWSLLREFRYLPREPGNISSFFMVFLFYCWRSRLVNDPLCTDRLCGIPCGQCLFMNLWNFHRLFIFSFLFCGWYHRGYRACLKIVIKKVSFLMSSRSRERDTFLEYNCIL